MTIAQLHSKNFNDAAQELSENDDRITTYIRYPPRERETNRKLNNPSWKIIPVTRKEVDDGIWRECPF